MKILRAETRKFGGVWETKFIIQTDSGKIEEEWVNSSKEPKSLVELEMIAISRLQTKLEEPKIDMIATDITSKYTPKEMLTKLQTVKDIDKATWAEVDK